MGGSLGCSDHALVDFSIFSSTGWVKCRVKTLNLRQAKFQLFRVLMSEIPWETALRGKRANEREEIF